MTSIDLYTGIGAADVSPGTFVVLNIEDARDGIYLNDIRHQDNRVSPLNASESNEGERKVKRRRENLQPLVKVSVGRARPVARIVLHEQ